MDLNAFREVTAMFATSSAFVASPTHPVCQDFALSGAAFAMVLDGCSSSPATDTGARLLAFSLAQQGTQSAFDLPQALHHAARIAQQLDLPLHALDATVGLVTPCQEGILAQLWGDGHILGLTHDRHIQRTSVAYADNTPFYPSYTLNPQRLALFRQHAVKRVQGQPHPPDAPTTILFPKEEFRLVAIATDGLGAFLQNGAPVPEEVIAGHLLAIPGFAGEFAVRRLRRMIKDLARDHVVPSDDIGVAMLAWTD